MTKNVISNVSNPVTPPSVCTNYATNYPTCTIFAPCTNQAINPPVCTTYYPCTNGGTNPPTCTNIIDTTKPIVTSFYIPITSSSFVIPITSLVATDNVGIVGYRVTESSTIPTYGWSLSKPINYIFTSAGLKHLYAWAKDTSGNVSTPLGRQVTITSVINTCTNGTTNYPSCNTYSPCTNGGTNPPICSIIPDTIKPVVTSFSIPTTYSSLTVPISNLIASDDNAIVGYLLTERSTPPLLSNSLWQDTKPTSYTFMTEGPNKYLYAWVLDSSGNVSSQFDDMITIVIPDTTQPVVTSFTIPSTGTSLTISITTFTATDNVS